MEEVPSSDFDAELAEALTWVAAHTCQRCGAVDAPSNTVEREPCRTAYADDRLNISPLLCRECADEYHAYWDSAWADYNSGRM
jgi:hypothetical protein